MMLDSYNRSIDYVRISVTDRCNFRCVYCMPPGGVTYVKQEEQLSFEEIIKVCKALVKIGISKVKITGGEPFVRKSVTKLIKDIKQIDGITSVTVTTNGYYLEEVMDELVEAQIDGINVSLDTCDASHFNNITAKDSYDKVLRGLEKAINSPIPSIKINFVPIKELNMDQIVPIVKFAKEKSIILRFIELMPIGHGTKFTPVTGSKIRGIIEENFGRMKPITKALGNGPAEYYELEGFSGTIGFICAVSEKFCSSCNRIRLTSNGFLKTCLHYNKGIHLKEYLNNDISQEDLMTIISKEISQKPQNHGFNDKTQNNIEKKSMVQIGG